MRRLVHFALLAGFWLYWTPSFIRWWARPVAVFFGRRTMWWDAEDFSVFYSAGELASRRDFGLLYSEDAHALIQLPLLTGHQEPLGFYNPPIFSLLFLPFSWLPYEQAFQAWSLVNLALAFVVCALLWRIAGQLHVGYRLAIIVGFLTLYPLTFGLRLGQFSLILTASWAAAYLFLREGRDRAAGAVLIPVLLKPELLIPITLFLAWKRRWEALRVLIPASAVAVGLSAAMLGPSGTLDYASHIASAAGSGTGNMYGWNGLLAPMFAPDDPGSMTAYALPLAIVSLLAAAYLWSGRLETGGSAFPMQWLALTVATVLWDAHFYLQDLIILAPAAAAVLATASAWRAYVCSVASLGGWVILGLGSVPSAIWGFNIFSAFLAACLLVLVAWKAGAGFLANRQVAVPEAAPAYEFARRAA